MANEGQYQITLRYNGTNLTLPQILTGNKTLNIAGNAYVVRTKTLSTSYAALDIGDLSGVGTGFMLVHNASAVNSDIKLATNVILIATTLTPTDAPLVQLLPDEWNIFRLGTILSPITTITPTAKALAGTPTLEYWILPAM